MSYKVTMEDDYSSDSEHSDSGHDELSNLLGDHSVSEQEMSGMVRSQSFVDETQRMMRGMNLRGMMMVVKSLFEIRNRISRSAELLAGLAGSLTAWVRTHKKETAFIIAGILTFVICLAMPSILLSIGFGAAGPALGSLAAMWQASLGSVAAGSLFAFLQSAAMGGAAIGVFTAVGALGAVVAVGGAAATVGVVKERCGEFAEKVAAVTKDGYQNAVGGAAATAGVVKERCGEFAEKMATVTKDGYQNAMAEAENIWKNSWNLFSKKKDHHDE